MTQSEVMSELQRLYEVERNYLKLVKCPDWERDYEQRKKEAIADAALEAHKAARADMKRRIVEFLEREL